MKQQRLVFVVVMAISLLLAGVHSQAKKAEEGSNLLAESADAFLGRWDLTLKAPDAGISLMVGTSRRRRTIEGPDGEPLGARKNASQSCAFKWPPHFRFS